MHYEKRHWISAFEDYLSILRPHLDGRRLQVIALVAWNGHHSTEPIKAALLVAEKLAGTARAPRDPSHPQHRLAHPTEGV